jgi:hypothetical protein
MRGTKNYSISEIKHLKPFKEIILNTETAKYFFEYFSILVFFCSRSYGERLKLSDCVVSLYHNDQLNSTIIECFYCTNGLYFKLNLYKNTGNSINQFLSPFINKVLNKYYLEVQLNEQLLILPISCIQKKAIVIKILL